MNQGVVTCDSGKLATLMEKYIGTLVLDGAKAHGKYTVRGVIDEAGRQALRAAYLKEMLKRGDVDDVPAILFPEESRCIAIYDSEHKIVGGAMFQYGRQKDKPILTFASQENEEKLLRILARNS